MLFVDFKQCSFTKDCHFCAPREGLVENGSSNTLVLHHTHQRRVHGEASLVGSTALSRERRVLVFVFEDLSVRLCRDVGIDVTGIDDYIISTRFQRDQVCFK